MRQVACDSRTCFLQPSNNSESEEVEKSENMLGGGSGLAPEESTFYVPLKSAPAKSTKRRKRSPQKGGRIKSVSVAGVKSGRVKKKKRHSKKGKARGRKSQVGGKRKKQKTGGKRRKCVKKK